MHSVPSLETPEPRRILILGGGFGGVRTALDLAKQKIPNTKIVLISDKHHFEFTPALYKLATGRSPMEMCIPLAEIFRTPDIEYLVDEVTGGSLAERVIYAKSGSRYKYDYLVLALGSETSYFNIPGIAENSFTLKSVSTALRLKNHLHELFNDFDHLSKRELMAQFQFVIVGGGPAGVELAGEIRRYARTLARAHGVSERLVTVDILQAAPRLLPTMPEEVSLRATKRLDELGINIILGRAVTGEDQHGVFLKDIKFNAKTIVWTAGVKPSHVYGLIEGLTLDKGGHVLVDSEMRAQGFENVFAIGDGAATPNAGTAQTAIYDGHYSARVIAHSIRGEKVPDYHAKKTPYVVPIGENWAVFTYKNIVLSGRIFWWLRLLIDLKFFLTILPFNKAFTIWREGGVICESCPTCNLAEEENRI